MKKQLVLSFLIVSMLIIGGFFFLYAFRGSKEFDGQWNSQGYGLHLKIRNGKMKTYQISNRQLVGFPLFNGRIKDNFLSTTHNDIRLKIEDDKLIFNDIFNRPIFTADRFVDSKSEYQMIKPSKDPLLNFNIFWDTFNENYPFFELYSLDWQQVYNDNIHKITSETTDRDLFDILSGMIAKLNDDHVYLSWNELEYSPYIDLPQWWKDSKAREIVQVIETEYIKELKFSKDRFIRYGKLNENTGYILLATMGGYQNDLEAVEKLSSSMEIALTELQEIPRIVLDIRFNRGGHDIVGNKYASYFTKERILAYSKKIRNGNTYTNIQDVYIEPDENLFYKGEIIVLTSKATVSAAETFLLSMKELDSILIIGEETAGFYSDMLPRLLPNKMEYGISHQIYYSAQNEMVERVGIQPDVFISIDIDSTEKKRDEALDWILEN